MTFFGLNLEETVKLICFLSGQTPISSFEDKGVPASLRSLVNFFYQTLYQSSLPNYIIFLLFVLLAIGIGKISPHLLKLILYLGDRQQKKNLYELIFKPISSSIKLCSTLLIIYWATLLWLQEYRAIYQFLEPLIGLVALITIAWIISRILKQLIRVYGIKLFRQSGLVVNELLLVFETLANIVIGFITVVIYAEIQNFSWLSLFAGISLSGAANVNFTEQLDYDLTRAMINFSILGSTENSIELRKNILDSTREEISEKLRSLGIEFVAQEPNIYVEAPITI